MPRTLKSALSITFAVLVVLAATTTASAQEPGPPTTFPADNAYTPVQCLDPSLVNGFDSCTDTTRDHRNVIGGGTSPAYQITNDGTYLFVRLRLEGDPRSGTGLASFAWGFGVDTNNNGRFDAYLSVIGSGTDRVEILDQDTTNGVTPDRTRLATNNDTSLQPVLTDFSAPSWVQVTAAPGPRFCGQLTGTDYHLTAAVPLVVLNDFAALGGTIAYGGSSSNNTGIQTDFVCLDGTVACTTGAQCPSGICLLPAGFCGPAVNPIALGCLDSSVDNSATDAGCNSTNRHCLVANNTSVCVPCISNNHCDDSVECTVNTCASNACTFPAAAVGTPCSTGVCDSAVTCATLAVDITSPADDSATSDNTPTISGTATRGITVSITIDGNAAGSTNSNSSGNWSFTFGSAVAEGTHTIAANVSASDASTTASDSIDLTIDTSTSVAITSPGDGDLITDNSPTIAGTGEPLATVAVQLDGNPIGAVQVDVNGDWFLAVPSSLAVGVHTVSATAQDTVGNTDSDSISFEVVQCLSTPDCSGALLCNTSSHTCVQCLNAGNCDDSNDCTSDACTSGSCSNAPVTTGDACSGGVCASSGTCVECVTTTDCSGAELCDTNNNTCVECLAASDCDDSNDCTTNTCSGGTCSFPATGSGTMCSTGVCDGSSACVECVTTTDCSGAELCNPTSNTCVQCISAANCDDSNDCTTDACSSGTCSNTPLTGGSSCGGGVCTTGGSCVQCLTANDCDDSNDCTTDTCNNDSCSNTPVSTGDACNGGVCNSGGNCVDCVDDDDCTGSIGLCNTGSNTCVQCLAASDCDDSNECTTDSCNSGSCGNAPITTGDACSGGVCNSGGNCVDCVDSTDCSGALVCNTGTNVCVQCVSASDCDDGNECTVDACSGDTCSNTAVSVGGSCSGGVCDTTQTCSPVSVTITEPTNGSATADATPIVRGRGTAGLTVSLTLDGNSIGSVTVDDNGDWLMTLTTLGDGAHTVVASVSSSNGSDDDTVTFEVDTSTQVAIVSPADGATVLDRTPNLRGVGEPGATVVVSIDGTEVGSVTVDSNGDWLVTLTDELTNDTYTIDAELTDQVGNTATATASFTVDVSSEVSIVEPVNGSAINDVTPSVIGTALPGATVVITIDDGSNVTTLGSVTADGTGIWSLEIQNALPDGSYTLVATATDPLGGMAQDSVSFRVDTLTSVSIDAVDVATGIIRGSGEAGASLAVTINGTGVGTATVDSSGQWTFNVGSAFAPGSYTVVVVATDDAGNSSSDSLSFEVEPPVDPDTDAGVTSDGGSDAAVFTDAGSDAAVIADAGSDGAVITVDASTDAATTADAGTDAGMVLVDAGLDLDAGDTDSGVFADSGTDAALMNDGAIEPPTATDGRYSGGCGCSTTGRSSGSPWTLLFVSCVIVGLVLRRRHRRG